MIRVLGFLFCSFFFSTVNAKPVEIILWHSLAGDLGSEVQTLADGFNHSQATYVIKPVYKGDYIESLTSFAAAFRAKQAPGLIQVFEVGASTMLVPKGIIKPVYQLMKEQGLTLPETSFFPAVKAYYSDQGQLMALPLNTSVPVLFYNKDALVKMGYSAQSFPTTWDEFERLALKFKQAGYSCIYTSAYPAWILIESFSATHGLPLMDASTKKANYNNEAIISHLTRLRRWQDLHYFQYGGRSDDSTILFTSGHCLMLSQSSGGYNSLTKLVRFRVGMAPLPLDNRVSNTRYNNVAGGAALWVVAGQSSSVYKGIAEFFIYLTKPSIQEYWHQHTGYLPLGIDGIYQQITRDSQHPSLKLAQLEFNNTKNVVSPLRIDAQNQIRAINDEALEMIFAGIKSPKQAMNEAVIRANHTLLRFTRNTTQ